jgi:dTDP-glucose 4,6-dehydratase
LPVNDPLQRQPDITKARELLGWEAKVNRAERMKITYDYFRSMSKEELSKEHKDFQTILNEAESNKSQNQEIFSDRK